MVVEYGLSILNSYPFFSGSEDLTPENEMPIGRNVLQLINIQESANYTCIAASTLGQIDSVSVVKVQCKWSGLGVRCIYMGN